MSEFYDFVSLCGFKISSFEYNLKFCHDEDFKMYLPTKSKCGKTILK